MRMPKSVRGLENLGRVALSKSFYMRDFLHSEISNFFGIPNIPENPDLAIMAGRQLCNNLLEPLNSAFGNISIRSAYRSPTVNKYGNKYNLNCASNEANYGAHIWDKRDAQGHLGAMACIVIPWFAVRYEQGADWRPMAWWIHDHLPYSSLTFYPKLAAFNIQWHEVPRRRIYSYISPKGCLTKPGMKNNEGNHVDKYKGFPVMKTIT